MTNLEATDQIDRPTIAYAGVVPPPKRPRAATVLVMLAGVAVGVVLAVLVMTYGSALT